MDSNSQSRTRITSSNSQGTSQLWLSGLLAYFIDSMGTRGEESYFDRDERFRRWSDSLVEEIAIVGNLRKPPEANNYGKVRRWYCAQLRRRIRRLECRTGSVQNLEGLEPGIADNVRAVGRLLALDDIEQRCLAFLLIASSDRKLRRAIAVGGPLDDSQAERAIAAALALPVRNVQQALSRQGRLIGSEMITWDHKLHDLEGKFDWISDGFRQAMLLPGFDPIGALKDRISIAPAPSLQWEQFSHFGDLQRVAHAYVRSSLASGTSGVNVLLHGKPGTGKTEFCRALARELDCDLYEVSTEDESGDPINSLGRLRALRLIHRILANRRALLVFDEIEDIFPSGSPFGQKPLPIKGWLNRVLESNPVITFWITNAVEAIDPAFVRRFDLVIEAKRAPAAMRERQLRDLPLTLPEGAIRAMASTSHLAPAVVSRAAKIVAAIQPNLPGSDPAQMIKLIINQTLQAQGHECLNMIRSPSSFYDPGYANAEVDLNKLAEGVRSAKSARICLYGPPGTGKTAFGHWLAKQVDLEIITKRASELLGPFVGMTERNIAQAFGEASDAGSLLLIDEVDSFLSDRSKALRSWEVTQVNELLVQMEQFDGIFIASTNLMDGLDPAALRRFDLKLKFGYLRPDQSRRLLAAHLASAGILAPDANALPAIDSLTTLTPGDFAAVARQHRFNSLLTPADWIAALEAECKRKPAFERQVRGFASATSVNLGGNAT